jgi:hypothetical protein
VCAGISSSLRRTFRPSPINLTSTDSGPTFRFPVLFYECSSTTSIRRSLFDMLDAGSGSEPQDGSVSLPEPPQNESRKRVSPWVPVSMVSSKRGVNRNCESKKRNVPLARCHDGSPCHTPLPTSSTACIRICTQQKRILFDGNLCAACEASAEARRPFDRTAASRSTGPDACVNERDSFDGREWPLSKILWGFRTHRERG